MASPYTLILNDVQTLTNVAPFTAGTSRIVRKLVARMPGDPLPLLLIVPFFQAKSATAFEGRIVKDYMVGLALLFAGNWNVETGLSTLIDAVYLVEKAVHVVSLPTATSVFDSEINLSPDKALFELAGLEANVDYSLMTITYRNEEARNS